MEGRGWKSGVSNRREKKRGEERRGEDRMGEMRSEN